MQRRESQWPLFSYRRRFHIGVKENLIFFRVHLWRLNHRTAILSIPSDVSVAQLETLLLRAYGLPADLPIILWGIDIDRRRQSQNHLRLDLMNVAIGQLWMQEQLQMVIRDLLVRYIEDPTDAENAESKTRFGIVVEGEPDGRHCSRRESTGILFPDEFLQITMDFPSNPNFEMQAGLCGFLNNDMDGVCYANTSIQCLYAITPLVEYLETKDFTTNGDDVIADPRSWDIARVVSNALHCIHQGIPYANFTAVKHIINGTEDAYHQDVPSEYNPPRTLVTMIRALIASTTLKSERNRYDLVSSVFLDSSADSSCLRNLCSSPVSEILASVLCTLTTCPNCYNYVAEYSEQPFYVVDFKGKPCRTLGDEFSQLSEVAEIWLPCQKCGHAPLQRIWFYARLAPYVVAVALLTTDDATQYGMRIVQPSINLGRYYMEGTQHIQYDLVAFSLLTEGHCTAHRKVGRTWYQFDDDLITKECDFNKSLGLYNAGMLVYKRADYESTPALQQRLRRKTSKEWLNLLQTHIQLDPSQAES